MERLSGPCDLDRDEMGMLSTSLQWSYQASTPSSLDIKCLSGESELNCAKNNDHEGGGDRALSSESLPYPHLWLE